MKPHFVYDSFFDRWFVYSGRVGSDIEIPITSAQTITDCWIKYQRITQGV